MFKLFTPLPSAHRLQANYHFAMPRGHQRSAHSHPFELNIATAHKDHHQAVHPPSAIRQQMMSGHQIRPVRCKENNGSGDFRHGAKATDRNSIEHASLDPFSKPRLELGSLPLASSSNTDRCPAFLYVFNAIAKGGSQTFACAAGSHELGSDLAGIMRWKSVIRQGR
ncbi:hypothetical protein [Rhizobium laguerreae]|uniref:hypothetical protein n=1 Tax=Rhizobium laguerreae TaxID=1076926 RepID=UPI001FE702E8|nr:hypothetical protein [Rhizobium laguerreae]